MSPGARLLAVWLTPVLWLEMPALVAERGPDGLWGALALALVPLIALAARTPEAGAARSEPIFPVVVLLLTVAILLWANMILAGDVASWLGEPRSYGIAAVAVGAWLLTAWRGSGRAVPALLLVAALAVSLSLVALARSVGVGPLAAWARVATQTAFRFPETSPWVTSGRDLAIVRAHAPIRFDEEHRVTAPAGGRLAAITRDAGRAGEVDWTLSPGQSITLRAGDLLRPGPGRVRFEADKRVPGSPVTGIAWAAGRPPDWSRRAGLLVTVLFGALALCRPGVSRVSRSTVATVAAGGLVALLWAEGWAVYSILASPDLFLGGVSPARLLAFPVLGGNEATRPALQAALLAGGLAGFLASSIALRERLGTLDRTGSGEIGHDLGLWAGVFAVAGLASLWPLDGWALALLGVGAAASSLGPSSTAWGAAAPPGATTLSGLAGLATFIAVTVAGQVRGPAEGALGALQAYPALAAVPVAAAVLAVTRRAARR